MSESVSTEKAPKKSFFKGVQSEFKKIIWPEKTAVCRQTVAVLIISVILGAVIKVIDMFIQYGLNFLR